jgi:fructuronate reductase/mannitol 2-dehydrogenase
MGVTNEWGVVGIGLRSGGSREDLLRQNCLYSLLERSPERDEVRVVGSLLDYIYAPGAPGAALAALTSETCKLVTLTVTGDGYGSESLLARVLAESLRLRRKAGIPPFTVLSCDNLPENGKVVRDAVLDYARRRDEESFVAWIEGNVSFPSSVVDRITPVTEPEHHRLLERDFGLHDRAPVVCEDYSQWIVEDDFCNDRPPLEEVGVRFVADVSDYEVHKKRLLNGSHSAIGYLGHLGGYERIDEAIGDPLLRGFVESLMGEVAPLLPQLLDNDVDEYRQTLLERFGNPRVGDHLQRLCRRGSTKMSAYLLPSLQEAVEQGRSNASLTLALAAWIRYLTGVDLDGRPIAVEDARWDTLKPLAEAAPNDPRPLLAEREIFGTLGDDEDFVDRLTGTIRLLDAGGPVAAIEACAYSEPALAA